MNGKSGIVVTSGNDEEVRESPVIEAQCSKNGSVNPSYGCRFTVK